jgi:hypothetical protein
VSVFEYVVILFSILFSIAFAHMLQSAAELVRAANRVRFSWLHAIWMLSVFIMVLANWIGLWELRDPFTSADDCVITQSGPEAALS